MATETAFISIITYDDAARQIVPLTELSLFEMPEIQARGDSSLGAALAMLHECMNREVAKGVGVKG